MMNNTENTRYFTNGKITDPHFTGLSVAEYQFDNSGTLIGGMFTTDHKPFFGYLPNEITKVEYDTWVEIIKSPDLVTYFPGIFPGRGVLDKKTYEAMQTARETLHAANAAAEAAKNNIGYLIASRDAASINQDPELVFRNYYPNVSEAAIRILFGSRDVEPPVMS